MKTKIQKLVEKLDGDYNKASRISAEEYLQEGVKYQKRKYMTVNTWTLSLLLREYYYAGLQAGVKQMADNLRTAFGDDDHE
jgi:hypothetical protein